MMVISGLKFWCTTVCLVETFEMTIHIVSFVPSAVGQPNTFKDRHARKNVPGRKPWYPFKKTLPWTSSFSSPVFQASLPSSVSDTYFAFAKKSLRVCKGTSAMTSTISVQVFWVILSSLPNLTPCFSTLCMITGNFLKRVPLQQQTLQFWRLSCNIGLNLTWMNDQPLNVAGFLLLDCYYSFL